MTTLRWGVASAGKISHDFCVAVSTLSSDEHQVVAVAARQKDRAEEFAKKHDIPNAFGSYVELVKLPEVDIIYVASLNPHHYEITMLALENGKHVLCEKPLAMNRKQAEKLIKYAEFKKLFLMEGVWSRFFPTYQYLRKQIATNVLGEIKEVDVTFGFEHTTTERLQKKELGGGVCLDLGVYTVQCSQWAFQEPPQKIAVIKSEVNEEDVDVDVTAELQYTGGRVSRMHFSAKEFLGNKAVIKGTKGEITLINFWCPVKLIDIDGKEKEWVLPKGKYPTNFPNSEGLRYEAEAVRQAILEGKLQCDTVSHNESLIIAHIQDELRKQIGVVYDADKE